MASPLLLMILDGWGYCEKPHHNAIALANTPHFDQLMKTCPTALLDACGESVGLPPGQMGNSEVGHLHIGAGRQVPQSLLRINQAIQKDALTQNPKLNTLFSNTQQTLHMIGLFSPGGVHSHEDHLLSIASLASMKGVKHLALHAILDGRDTPPQSALSGIEKADAFLKALIKDKANTLESASIASICGRYYAMDRDNRWERTALAYHLYTQPSQPPSSTEQTAKHFSASETIKQAYANGLSDEFIPPTRLTDSGIQNGDSVIFANFRADRMRQLVQAFIEDDFNAFKRDHCPNLASLATLTAYQENFNCPCIFPQLPLEDTLGACLSEEGIAQCRIAETEKFAHVTYFLNGGNEKTFPGETRILIPSNQSVSTYDQAPEMQAIDIANAVIEAIEKGEHQAIICNFANADMVGHTGNLKATIQAVETIDQCIGSIIQSIKQHDGQAIITADHGNAEAMFNADNQQAHTSHTNNPVPMIYIGPPAQCDSHGKLLDIAPTMLKCLGIEPPSTMKGKNLIHWNT